MAMELDGGIGGGGGCACTDEYIIDIWGGDEGGDPLGYVAPLGGADHCDIGWAHSTGNEGIYFFGDFAGI